MVLDIITGILGAYLALTNSAADFINDLLPADKPATAIVAPTTTEPTAITAVASNYERGGTIPSILINNASYQSANVLEGVVAASTTASPLESVVNIYCTYTTDEYIRVTTGTGFFIDPAGIIMTNAHVAQFLLLADIVGDSECVVRTGSPAVAEYTVDILYISPAWLREHASIINEEAPKGTGERDYALLYVNGTVDNDPIPARFPALGFDTTLIPASAQDSLVTITGYPAGGIGDDTVNNLIPRTASSSMVELLTFGSNQADLMSLRGTDVGAQGASGGPITDEAGNAIGVIVTRGDDVLHGAGSLRAITLPYIDRTMQEETGVGLAQQLTGDLPYRAQLYKRTMVPFLETILRWELE